jgi:hypothetical protein
LADSGDCCTEDSRWEEAGLPLTAAPPGALALLKLLEIDSPAFIFFRASGRGGEEGKRETE